MHNPRLALSLAMSSVIAVNLSGCQTLNDFAVENPGLTCGASSAVTGGATWALCNYGLGGDQATCILTAVAVAAVDGMACYWSLKQKLLQDYEQTQQAIGYDPSQGYVVRILDFSATPTVVKPGEKVMINARFALMGPDRNEEIAFERKITLPNDNKPRVQSMTYQPGTWGVEGIPFDVDGSSPDGKIQLTLELSIPKQNKVESRNLCFNISKSGAIAAQDQCPVNNDASTPAPAAPLAWFTIPKSKKPVRLREQPSSKAKYSTKAPAGFKYPVLDSAEQDGKNWYLLQLENDESGWIQSTAGKLEQEAKP